MATFRLMPRRGYVSLGVMDIETGRAAAGVCLTRFLSMGGIEFEQAFAYLFSVVVHLCAGDRMSRPKSAKPTDAELSILKVLWQRGPSTVRDVQEVLNVTRRTGYTTALKLLQIMTDKGHVSRDESNRAHVYHPSSTETGTQQQLVGDLLDRAFGGSAMKLVLHSLTSQQASPEDIQKIREMLTKLEHNQADVSDANGAHNV
jgi:BlaI family penicillinase repressor